MPKETKSRLSGIGFRAGKSIQVDMVEKSTISKEQKDKKQPKKRMSLDTKQPSVKISSVEEIRKAATK